MKATYRIFLIWFALVAALWAFANWPRNVKFNVLFTAGFPWEFASWIGNRLDSFNLAALAADITLGVVLAMLLATACAWSRRRSAERRTTYLTRSRAGSE
jgi:hypothetical protein